jgi:glutamate racemase
VGATILTRHVPDAEMIGLFDSGVGGLTVFLQLRDLVPQADVIYLADRAHAPYGDRSLEEVAAIADACTRHLLDSGAETIVVACNTASAAGLKRLRATYPPIPFVGMEPALKPALSLTRNRIVGVLATAATFQGELFASLNERYGSSIRVVNQPCPGWVELVEAGQVEGAEVEAAVERHLGPVLSQGADTLVLGCTHYPFLRPVIARLAGPQVTIVDPARAVANQVVRVATSPGSRGRTVLHTTDDPETTRATVRSLTGLDLTATAVTLSGYG